MNNRHLPNFLIVGAAKSGTTSLHHYLRQHPDIFMPDFKEPQYLVASLVENRIHKYVDNIGDYSRLFESASEKHIGEASVFYLYFYEEAIKNIKKELGSDTKIIAILRNPVDRAVSAYYHVRRNNLDETLTFEKALEVEKDRLFINKTITPMVLYAQMGLYSDAIKAYKEAFDHVHVIIYDDFIINPKDTVKKVFEFLQVSSSDIEIDFNQMLNQGGWQWNNEFIRNLFLNSGTFKKILRAAVPKRLRKNVRDSMREYISTSQENIGETTRLNLREYFISDIEKLEHIIGVDLKRWKK